MQIVIDISKDKYDEIMAMDWANCRRFFDEEIRAIHDGTPLPKGHGRLIDADKLSREIFIIDSYSEEPVRQQISDAPTIIEADKAERSGEE